MLCLSQGGTFAERGEGRGLTGDRCRRPVRPAPGRPAALLENAGFHVVARTRDLHTALDELQSKGAVPALLLTDVMAWRPADIDALRGIRALSTNTRVVVLADRLASGVAESLLSVGVQGFLTPDIQEAALSRYLELVLLGEHLFHPDIRAPGQDGRRGLKAAMDIDRLTARECDVLRLLGRLGLSNKQIANSLHIADGTVKIYVRNLCRKLGQKNRTQLATWAVVNNVGGWPEGNENVSAA